MMNNRPLPTFEIEVLDECNVLVAYYDVTFQVRARKDFNTNKLYFVPNVKVNKGAWFKLVPEIQLAIEAYKNR